MKMREALLNIQEYAAGMDVDDGNVLAILDACRDALAAPDRQCDVGTAEEQCKRLDLFCHANSEDESERFPCGKCPYGGIARCDLYWAQTPYEAQEGAGE